MADWTVYIWGGGTGSYKVIVYYGDGFSKIVWFASGGTKPWDSHTFSLPDCGSWDYTQSWSAWRSGGGTDYYTTYVYAN